MRRTDRTGGRSAQAAAGAERARDGADPGRCSCAPCAGTAALEARARMDAPADRLGGVRGTARRGRARDRIRDARCALDARRADPAHGGVTVRERAGDRRRERAERSTRCAGADHLRRRRREERLDRRRFQRLGQHRVAAHAIRRERPLDGNGESHAGPPSLRVHGRQQTRRRPSRAAYSRSRFRGRRLRADGEPAMKNTFLNARFSAAGVFVAAVLLVALWGARAGAQQETRVTAIRDDATRSVVIEQLSIAKEHGVPMEPLLSKALEGVAKNASSKSIRAAMDALQKRLRRANDLLAPSPTVDELSAGADALYVGVPAKTLKQMRQAAPRR